MRLLKIEVIHLKTNDLAIEAKLSILESQKIDTNIPPAIPLDISGIPKAEISDAQFL